MKFLDTMTLVILLLSVAVEGGDLSTVDFEGGSLEGKTLFVAFHAPWCGHCKKLMPTWKATETALEDEEGLGHVIMGRVDCTENEKLCTKRQVRGYPTILYGSVDHLEPYEGGRGEDELVSFARSLKPVCGMGNEAHCSEEEARALDGMIALDADALRDRLESHEKSVQGIEAAYKAEVETLQEMYTNVTEAKRQNLEALRDESRIVLLKHVLRVKHDEL